MPPNRPIYLLEWLDDWAAFIRFDKRVFSLTR